MRAFIFPGQGSQAVGMGKALAEASSEARAVFEEVDAALGQKLASLMAEGPADELMLTENAQPAIMANAIATFRVLQKEGGISLADKAVVLSQSGRAAPAGAGRQEPRLYLWLTRHHDRLRHGRGSAGSRPGSRLECTDAGCPRHELLPVATADRLFGLSAHSDACLTGSRSAQSGSYDPCGRILAGYHA